MYVGTDVDTVTVTCDTLSGQRITAAVQITKRTRLGCGCNRLETERPDGGRMHLLTGCGMHTDDLAETDDFDPELPDLAICDECDGTGEASPDTGPGLDGPLVCLACDGNGHLTD